MRRKKGSKQNLMNSSTKGAKSSRNSDIIELMEEQPEEILNFKLKKKRIIENQKKSSKK